MILKIHKIAWCLFLTFFLFTATVSADDGEFWDAAVSSISYTKKIEKSHLQLKVGSRYLMQVNTQKVPAAPWSALSELTFYGIKTKRYTRLFSMYGQAGIGLHDDGNLLRLDSHRARLSVYHYLNGGAFSVAVFDSERNKALNEQLSLSFRSMEYSVGGAMKSFVFGLTTGALGYEYRNYFSLADYHGFFIFELNLAMGFLIAPNEPLSLEIKFDSDVAFSWPRQKDVELMLEMVLHLNNRVLPLDLSVNAGYDYYTEEADNNVTYDYFFTSALLGIRF